jgi:hypothetical protein
MLNPAPGEWFRIKRGQCQIQRRATKGVGVPARFPGKPNLELARRFEGEGGSGRAHPCCPGAYRRRPKGRREVPSQGRHGGLVQERQEDCPIQGCPIQGFAGCPADDMLTEFRARWLWDDRETTAQRVPRTGSTFSSPACRWPTGRALPRPNRPPIAALSLCTKIPTRNPTPLL